MVIFGKSCFVDSISSIFDSFPVKVSPVIDTWMTVMDFKDLLKRVARSHSVTVCHSFFG